MTNREYENAVNAFINKLERFNDVRKKILESFQEVTEEEFEFFLRMKELLNEDRDAPMFEPVEDDPHAEWLQGEYTEEDVTYDLPF